MALRRGRRSQPPPVDEPVDLDAPEHAWWSREPETASEPATVGDDDPYVVLKVSPSADWDEILASYRRLARMWHPDGLRDPAPGERELCDDMIRRLNVAYTELRVRRGR
jgi:DnaJ-domain-containing protein 1